MIRICGWQNSNHSPPKMSMSFPGNLLDYEAKGMWMEFKVSDQLPLRRKIVSDYLADPRVLLSVRGRQKGRAGRRCGCSEGSERDGFADGRRGCEPRSVGRS